MKVIMGLRLYYEATVTPICHVVQVQSSYMAATRYPRVDPGTMGEFYGIRSQGDAYFLVFRYSLFALLSVVELENRKR
jgi:hypothetical protein